MKKNEMASLDREFHIERYWHIIKPRWHILVLCLLVAVVIGLVKSFSVTPLYKAQGILMIAPEREGTITFNDRIAFARPDMEYFNTQVRLFKSRSLARRVLTALNTSSYQSLPENSLNSPNPVPLENFGDNSQMSRRVNRFLSILEVSPLVDTRLVEVSYTSLNAERAAEVVNTLFDKYIEFNRELKTQTTRQTSEFINRQMDALERELGQKEEELQNYSKRKDLFYLTNEESAEVGKFSDFNTAYTEAQIDRINKESLYRELENKDFRDFPTVRNNSLINNLKNNYSNLEAEYKRKSQVFKESYPEMEKLKSQMESIQQRIQAETKEIAEQTLKEAKTEYESALNKENSLRKRLDKQKKVMVESNSDAIHYKSLSIEIENMRNLLNYLDRKHKEILLSSTSGEGTHLSNIKIIDRADVPRKPIAPKRKMILIMALILGISAGLGLIFFLDFLDRTVKSPEDIKTLLDVPTLGIIPSSRTRPDYYAYLKYLPYRKDRDKNKNNENGPGMKNIEMINYREPESPLAESYRNIRTSILLSTAGRAPRIITISSARPDEGKTSTSINLAIAFNQLGKKVLLVDGDLRKSRLHKVFRLKNTVGLSSYLVGRAKWPDIVKKTEIPNLFVIPSGPIPPNPVELLDSEIMTAMLKEKAAPEYDFIFIDAPPFIDIVDPILLGKLSDGVIMVTWSGKTNRQVVEKVKEKIDQFGIRLLGVVLNKVSLKGETYGYRYVYRYSNTEHEEVARSATSP